MRLTKSKLKEIIREELMNEATYNDTPKNRKLKRVGKPYNTRRGAGNRGGGTKFPQARPKGGPVKPITTRKNARKNKSPGTDPDKHTTITRKHAGDRLNLQKKLKKVGGDYANTAMSWDEFDDIPDITDLIPKKKKTKESLKLTKSKLKEMIKEELLNEKRFIDPDEAGQAINYALDDLKHTLNKVRNPEKWAEKYHRGLPDVIEMIERITKVLSRMK